MEKSEKGFVPALILCILLGGFGAHRFYVGKPLTAIMMILTLGGLSIWALIDLIVIATGNFKDSKGLAIYNEPGHKYNDMYIDEKHRPFNKDEESIISGIDCY